MTMTDQAISDPAAVVPQTHKPADPQQLIRFEIVAVVDETTEGLGRWICEILTKGVTELEAGKGLEPVGPVQFIHRGCRDYVTACTAEKIGETGDPDVVLLVIATFMDGMSERGRASFQALKNWAGREFGGRKIIVQAINGKNGQHNYWTRKLEVEVVMANLALTVSRKLRGIERLPKSKKKKLPPVDELEEAPAPVSPQHGTPSSVASSTPTTSPPEDTLPPPPLAQPLFVEPSSYLTLTPGEFEHLVASTKVRLKEHGREHTMKIGISPDGTQDGVPEAEFDANLEAIQRVAAETGCGTRVTATKKLPKNRICAEVLLRMDSVNTYIDMRVAVCGNVDSGKSTLTGVLSRGGLDDGRGLVRAKVFNHKHELDTGRTSSVSEQHLGFDANGGTVNYAELHSPDGTAIAGGNGKPPTTTGHHKITPKELSGRSAKVVTLYDLAGHEKYLKTTVQGMTGTAPDYACIVISANNGIQRMTKEHLGLCLALRIPFFIVVTRMDSTPPPVIKSTLESITKMLKLPTVRKLPYYVKRQEDVVISAKNLRNDKICPIFQVSNVTGMNIDLVIEFLNLSPVRKDWTALAKLPKELIIDSTFYVTGVGTVVGGIITKGTFKVNDTLYLGPSGNGAFRSVQIKSIQVKGLDVQEVGAGHDAAFALKKEKRNAIRKGNVLLEYTPKTPPAAYREFTAEIIVLYHSTTIKSRYEPVIHCSTIRQSAVITLVDGTELLRTGDKAVVRFKFLYRPEYLTIGAKLVFREGRTKGLGTVTGLLDPNTKSWVGVSGGEEKREVGSVAEKAE